jgi:hypothetical protein
MSIYLIEGFDTRWFRPDMDNSLVPIVPKWGYPVPDFAMPKTAENLNMLQPTGLAGGYIRSPLSVYTKLPLHDICFGFWFRRTHELPALLWSIWDGEPTKPDSKLLCGAYVNPSGRISIFTGGTWDRDAPEFGLSGQTDIATTSYYTLPMSDSGGDRFIETQIRIGTNVVVGGLEVLKIGEIGPDGELDPYTTEKVIHFSGTLPSSPDFTNLFLWLSSNYSYKDAQNNYIAVHRYDHFYLVINDGYFPSRPLKPVFVWTSRPLVATVTEWYATAAGHANAVNEDWVSHPSNDSEYIYTNKRGVRNIWKFSNLDQFAWYVWCVQLTAWCNFQNFPPHHLGFIVQHIGGVNIPHFEAVFQPDVEFIEEAGGRIGYATKVFHAFRDILDIDRVRFGVMTG